MYYGKDTNIFLIFRVFDHSSKGTGFSWAQRKFLNVHERWIKDTHGDIQDRRAFSHVEMILDDRRWVGIINGGDKNEGVFLKSKLEYAMHVNICYPQVVMIKVTHKQHRDIVAFIEEHKGQPFDGRSMLINMLSHKLGCAYRAQSRDTWYCTKLIVAILRHGSVVGANDLSLYTSTSEDIFRHCVSKQQEGGEGEGETRNAFYVYKLHEFPDRLIVPDGSDMGLVEG